MAKLFTLLVAVALCTMVQGMSKYDGEWYGMYDGFLRGTISGEMLIWGNGVGMPVSYDGEGRLLLAEFVGELNANCEIDWNDGDIWIKMDGSGCSGDDNASNCVDIWDANKCNKMLQKNRCDKKKVMENCQQTCDLCEGSGGDNTEDCVDIWKAKKCNNMKKKNRCGKEEVMQNCQQTCDLCGGSGGSGSQVSCGGHYADSCSDCPQGNGASWCNGDCIWYNDQCILTGDAPVPTQAPTEPPVTRDPTEPRSVLWIGNSYTYGNDLPKMVEQLAANDGKTIRYDQHTNGGWTWGKHAASATTINKIKSKKWDVVVLQEQSQLPAFGEHQVCAESVAPLLSLMDAIRSNSQDTVAQFFGTWGRPGEQEFEQWQYWLTDRYRSFACMVPAPARLVPVGEGFKAMEATHGVSARLALYNSGDHHASKQGTYLAACMHFLGIYGQGTTVVGNSYRGGLDANTARKIQEVAEAVYFNGDNWDHPTDDSCTDNFTYC